MHEGHRKRLYNKLKSGDNLYDHEYLEILLYNAYPRKNTNPIASALLSKFASIGAIFDADIEELTSVKGVGENVALYLKCVGMCTKRAKYCDNFATLNNMEEFKQFLSVRFKGKRSEVLEVYLLDKKSNVIRILSYTSNSNVQVLVRSEDIIKAVSLCNAYGAFVAHNHIGVPSAPSPADDDFTKQCQVIFSLSGVEFFDHCIYAADDDIYSYRQDDILDDIKSEYNIYKMVEKGKKWNTIQNAK